MNLDEYQNTALPNDYTITGLLENIIMVEFTDGDGDNVIRDGVFLPIDMATKLWRVGKILLMGPKCSEQLKIGDHVCFPNDKGLRMINKDTKTKYVFLNEERLFGIVKKIETSKKEKK